MKYYRSAILLMRAKKQIVSRIDMECVLVSHHINFWYVIYCSQGEGSISQTRTTSSVDRERSTLPRRRTGFNAGALIPGSVSTMVSLPESDEDQTVTTLASPSFQSMLDGDASSEYETDLEEDFPGKSEYMDKHFVVCFPLHSLAKSRTDLAGVSLMCLAGGQLVFAGRQNYLN